MNAITAARYLLAIAGGIAVRAVRVITDRHCPCEFCRAHRRFVRESASAYRRQVSSLPAITDRGA